MFLGIPIGTDPKSIQLAKVRGCFAMDRIIINWNGQNNWNGRVIELKRIIEMDRIIKIDSIIKMEE